jgi:DNA-binding NarL/FixJ family response regulator
MQSPQAQATVVFAEGDATLRGEVVEKLSSRRSLTLAGVAKTLAELVELVEEAWPDVVILGRNLPGVTQAAVVRRISGVRPQMPILLMTQTGSAHTGVAEALREGARVALRYDCSALQIASAVLRAHAGEWGPQDAANGEDIPLPLLTPRESAVLGAVMSGRPDRDCWTGLGMSERTFRTHERHVRTKLDVKDRDAMVARAKALQRRYLLDGTDSPPA